jgi:eukaryotic-like serine/threonine-protein kinase
MQLSAPEPDTQVVPPRDVRAEPVVLQRFVGRYELIHRLARGGMASVYLGRAKGKAGFEKIVAVKVIHPHLADEAEFVGMFLDEARIAARIHHPHVVEILDLGESDGAYFMVMEFIEGENLSALTRALGRDGERLPVAVALQIVADLLEGLGAAPELVDENGRPYELVHRDVSPHNILINLDGWAKVGDFGIMKAAGKASNTKTGELRGKLAYMSPEQARGGAVDLRTDLFAVGVILWELLTGRRLFACASEAATLEKVIACKIPPLAEAGLAEVPDEFDIGLQRLLDRALASTPDGRPADAVTMLAEVKRLLRLAAERHEDGAEEPRVHLAKLMRSYFSRRVDYARAALRRTGEHDALPPSAHEWRVEPTLPVERDLEHPLAEEPSTGSNPSVSVSGSGSAPHPAASAQPRPTLALWSMWLLLPMLGAGIAIVVMLVVGPTLERSSEPVDEAPEPAPLPPLEERPVPSSIAATEYQPVARKPTPGQVRWYFSTTPRGATVIIDGEVRGDPTPTWIHVAISDDPLDIRLELDGYEPRTLQLPPVHDQTFSETLDPLAPAIGEAAKRVRKPSKTKPATAIQPKTDGGASKTDFVPVPDSLRDP